MVRHIYDGRALLRLLPDYRKEPLDLFFRKGGGRLVEEKQPGFLTQHPNDLEHMLLGNAQRRNLCIQRNVEPEGSEYFPRFLPVLTIDRYMTFPVLEKAKLFRLILFNFLTGNEDAHLKNYSVIVRGDKRELSPCYDLLNSTLALGGRALEESALPLSGKKKNFTQNDFFSPSPLGCSLLHLPLECGLFYPSSSNFAEPLVYFLLWEGERKCLQYSELVEMLKSLITTFPDKRKGNNCHYSLVVI